jgi:hypothetical protein
MKKIHIFEIIAVSFMLILSFYFSLPFFLESQTSKQVRLLKNETQDLVDHANVFKPDDNINTIYFGKENNISSTYEIKDAFGKSGFPGYIDTEVLELIKKNITEETKIKEIFIMQIISDFAKKEFDHKAYLNVSFSTTPFGQAFSLTDMQSFDHELREHMTQSVNDSGITGLQPAIDFLDSKSYHASNGLISEGFIMSYQLNEAYD